MLYLKSGLSNLDSPPPRTSKFSGLTSENLPSLSAESTCHDKWMKKHIHSGLLKPVVPMDNYNLWEGKQSIFSS